MLDVLESISRQINATVDELHFQLARGRRATRPGLTEEGVLELLAALEREGLIVQDGRYARLLPPAREILPGARIPTHAPGGARLHYEPARAAA